MSSVKLGWVGGGVRSFLGKSGVLAAFSACFILTGASACSSNGNDSEATNIVGAGGTTGFQAPASESGTPLDETTIAKRDVETSARAFMASHPVRPVPEFTDSGGEAGQGPGILDASQAPAFSPVTIARDLPGAPSTPTIYPLSSDGKYYKANLLRRSFFPPTASATFSAGVGGHQDPRVFGEVHR